VFSEIENLQMVGGKWKAGREQQFNSIMEHCACSLDSAHEDAGIVSADSQRAIEALPPQQHLHRHKARVHLEALIFATCLYRRGTQTGLTTKSQQQDTGDRSGLASAVFWRRDSSSK